MTNNFQPNPSPPYITTNPHLNNPLKGVSLDNESNACAQQLFFRSFSSGGGRKKSKVLKNKKKNIYTIKYGLRKNKIIKLYPHKITKKNGRYNYYISWKTTKKNLPNKRYHGKFFNTIKHAKNFNIKNKKKYKKNIKIFKGGGSDDCNITGADLQDGKPMKVNSPGYIMHGPSWEYKPPGHSSFSGSQLTSFATNKSATNNNQGLLSEWLSDNIKTGKCQGNIPN